VVNYKDMAPRRITLQEAADRLDVHYMTAYRYVRTGRLPAEREGVQWMVDPADLKQLRKGRPARAAAQKGRAADPEKLALRMVAGDEAGSWALIEAGLTSGMDPLDVHLQLLVPALRAVGDGWERGRWTVADEHRASVVAQRLIGRLGPRFARRGRKRGTVVVGAPAGEQHGLPTAIVSDLLRGAGFEVADLGANTPADSFVGTAQHANRLLAVIIGVTTPDRPAAVRSTIRALRSAGIDAPILLGGAAIGDEAESRRLGADAWTGPDARAAVDAVEELLARPDRR
jgi:excisionase family DNA binding protein